MIPGATLVARDGLGPNLQLVLGSDFAGVKSASGATKAAASAAPPSDSPAGRTAADAGCIN